LDRDQVPTVIPKFVEFFSHAFRVNSSDFFYEILPLLNVHQFTSVALIHLITLTSVTEGGPAEQVGIQAGDVILAINDHYVFTVGELNEEISHHQPGTSIDVRYRRRAIIYEIALIVGRRH
jgi:membrane-associated protease RseP (regulator of RpoE activity)